MNIKSKIIAKINKKAQKIREKRVEAANNKTLENYVFDFFRDAEESRGLHNNKKYDPILLDAAKKTLEKKIKIIDVGAKISVEFEALQDLTSNEETLIRGVTIWWSQKYIAINNVHPSLFIDVSQMLFL